MRWMLACLMMISLCCESSLLKVKVTDLRTGRVYLSKGFFDAGSPTTFRDTITDKEVTLDAFEWEQLSEGAYQFHLSKGRIRQANIA